MAELPIIVTREDANNPNLLFRLLGVIVDKISQLGNRLDELRGSIKIPSFSSIQSALQATGPSPLNVTGLRGILSDAQPAAALRYDSVPSGQPLQGLRDSQLLLVKNGAAYDLYTVLAGNPNTLFKLLAGASGGSIMTTDTNQTPGATVVKTWTAEQIFNGGLRVGDGTAAASMRVNGVAGQAREVFFQTNGVNRFSLRGANAAAEGGANAGSNFRVIAYDDAGAGIGTFALEIVRATLYADFGGNVGIKTAAGAAALSVNGGVHVGGDTDPGDNNLLVDGTAEITGNVIQTAKTTKYNNISTIENGVPAEYASAIATNSGANIGTTTIYTIPTPAAYMYRVSYYIWCSTAGAAGDTITLNFSWDDGTGVKTWTATTIALTTVANFNFNTINLPGVATKLIQVATTGGVFAGGGRYSLKVIVEAL